MEEGVAATCIAAAPGVAAARAAAAFVAAAARVAAARWWSTGSHPTESMVEQNCDSSGYWIFCVSHRPTAAVPRNPDGKKQRKTNN